MVGMEVALRSRVMNRPVRIETVGHLRTISGKVAVTGGHAKRAGIEWSKGMAIVFFLRSGFDLRLSHH